MSNTATAGAPTGRPGAPTSRLTGLWGSPPIIRLEITLTIKHGVYPIHGHHDTKKCRVKVVSLLQCVLRSECCQPMSYLCILQLNRFLGFLSDPPQSTQPPPAPHITTFYSGSFAPYTLLRGQKSFIFSCCWHLPGFAWPLKLYSSVDIAKCFSRGKAAKWLNNFPPLYSLYKTF